MRRKYKALQGIVIKNFVYLYFSPLQKTMAIIVEPPLPLFKGGGIDLTKNPKKGGDGKIAEGQGDPKKRGGRIL